jgi:hypothetical protein
MAIKNTWSWKDAPDLMDRLSRAQNALRTPIDIMTIAGFFGGRDELLRHVEHYEARVAKQAAMEVA